MAKLNGRISGKCVGDTIPIQRTFQDVALIEITLAQVVFMVKRKEKDDDSAAIVSITITTGSAPQGRITDANPVDGSIAFFIKVTPAESLRFKPLKDYFYGMKTLDTSGEKYTLEKGIWNLEKAIVQA